MGSEAEHSRRLKAWIEALPAIPPWMEDPHVGEEEDEVRSDAKRRRDIYLKPKVPEVFALVDANGLDNGPFFRERMVRSTLPGRPWGFAGPGPPRPLRVLRQEGNVLHCDDGTWTIVDIGDQFGVSDAIHRQEEDSEGGA